ncbi:MAG: hypothetical protein RBT35_08890 [Bacteroidales bacterium]|jgi:hypothetical protein|nr:hypothetical protein [Bacteroidales bacterium]
MALLVQKSAGLLSELVAGNEFYETCYQSNLFPVNTGGADVGYCSILSSSAKRYIAFTPNLAGDMQGVILAIYAVGFGTNLGRNIVVDLEENVSGTWTVRASKTIATSDFGPTNTNNRFHGCVDFRFDTPYPITTDSDKWRFAIYRDGTGSGTFQVKYSTDGSDESNLFFIPYLSSTATLTSSDGLVLTDKITVDDDLSLAGINISRGTQTGRDANSTTFCLWACADTPGKTPQIYVPSDAEDDYSITFDGCFFMSSFSKPFLVGEDADNPLPSSRTLDIYFPNNSATDKRGFISHSMSSTSYYGKNTLVELWGTKAVHPVANFTETAEAGQPVIRVEGDVTSEWTAGKHIILGGAQSSTEGNQDFIRVDSLVIDSAVYADGVTTITFTSNLVYKYTYLEETPPIAMLMDRNIVVRGNDTTFTNESYHSFQGSSFKLQGVSFQHIYYWHSRYLYSAQYTADEKEIYKTYIDDVVLFDSAAIICNTHQFGGTVNGIYLGTSVVVTTAQALYPISIPYGLGWVVNDIYAIRSQYAINLAGGGGHTINNIVARNVQYVVNLSSGTASNIITDINAYRSRMVLYMQGCNFNEFNNVTARWIYYQKSNAATTMNAQGVIYNNAAFVNIDNTINNLDVDEAFCIVRALNDMFSTMFIDGLTTNTATFNDGIVSEGNTDYRDNWSDGSEIKISNIDGNPEANKSWFTRGQIEATGDDNEDTTSHSPGSGKKAWRFLPYFTDRRHYLSFNIPVTKPDEPVSISIYCKINSLNYASGEHIPPKFTMSGLGMNASANTAYASVDTTDWQVVVISGTPAEAGQITVTIQIQTDAVGSDAYVYWDDIYISYRSAVDLGGLDNTYQALPIVPPLTVNMVAGSVWSELLSNNEISGSFGEKIKKLHNHLEL